jgi:hypothetical protein
MKAIELFFNIVDYDVLIRIANNIKISINGFKNIEKAPELLLRRGMNARFGNKISIFKTILEDLYGPKLEELKKNSVEDFIYNFLSYPLRDKVPNHVALGMLIWCFPEYAESMTDKFKENIKNGRHIFYGCIEEEEITEDNCFDVFGKLIQLGNEVSELNQTIIKVEKLLEKIEKIDDYKALKSRVNGVSFLDFAKDFKSLREEYPDYLLVAAYLSCNVEKIKESEGVDREFYNKLSIYVFQCVMMECLIVMEKKLKAKDEIISSLENKVKTYDKSLKVLEENIVQMNDKINEYEERISNILNAKNEQLDEGNDQQAADIDRDYEVLIITSCQSDRIFDVVGNYLIISPDNVNLLYSNLDGFNGEIFIDRCSIRSTKELIELEKLIKSKNKKKSVVWSKTPEELVRNIIIKKFKQEG